MAPIDIRFKCVPTASWPDDFYLGTLVTGKHFQPNKLPFSDQIRHLRAPQGQVPHTKVDGRDRLAHLINIRRRWLSSAWKIARPTSRAQAPSTDGLGPK